MLKFAIIAVPTASIVNCPILVLNTFFAACTNVLGRALSIDWVNNSLAKKELQTLVTCPAINGEPNYYLDRP